MVYNGPRVSDQGSKKGREHGMMERHWKVRRKEKHTMGYKSYTAEYKTKVVLEVLREEKPLGEIASGYGLNPNMVRNWKTDFLAKASSVFENPEKAAKKAKRKEDALEKRNAQMLKTIGQLTLERDYLQECFRQSGKPVPRLDSEGV